MKASLYSIVVPSPRSRETALYIRANSSDFIEIDNGKIFLKKDILDSTNKDIQKELKDLDSNISEYIHS